ncbi:MAG: sulfatase-like hydrolase/transferase [Thermoanaerobaculia bacterium]
MTFSAAPAADARRGTSAPGWRSRFRIALGLWFFFVFLGTLTRLALVLAGHNEVSHSVATLARIFATGTLLDLWVAAWCVLPLVAYLALLPERWWQARWQKAALSVGLVATLYGALFVAAAEWFFFEEFDSRFNFVAVDYLLYPTEVLTNIWQSYPTGKVLVALAAIVATLFFALRARFRPAWEVPTPLLGRLAVLFTLAGLLALLAVSVSPRKLIEHSPDRLVRELTSNGFYAFGEALLGLDAPYDGFYATRDEGENHRRLEDLLGEPASTPVVLPPGSSARSIRALAPARRWNVVLLLEESLGSEFIGALHPGEDEHLTPEFDALTAQGVLFTQAFSTGNRTIRAIEATTSSLPPLPGASIVGRRGSKDLFTLPGVLGEEGYQTLFVYGGRALFDGMGPYLSANGMQRIVEQSDFPAGEFSTAWGVSDQAILDRSLAEMEEMDRSGKPFFTMILSVSNHRPYTYPPGTIEPLPGLKRRQNVVRYADWAIGRFFRAVREKSFYDHTLFIVMGDHGARVYGSATIPLASYQIPMLMIAPGVLPAGEKVDTLASSLDLPPTILSILGLSYASRFFGHDLLHTDPERGRALFVHNSDIALMRNGHIAILGLRQQTDVFAVDRASGDFQLADKHTGPAEELVGDAIAYFQSADRLVRNGGYGLAVPEIAPGLPESAAVGPVAPAEGSGTTSATSEVGGQDATKKLPI